MNAEIVHVTKSFLPPLEELIPYLTEIWNNKLLTNGGPMHQRLEQALSDYLGVEHIALCSNGTIALITAVKALGITGEVITTPYSFVATSHSLLWNDIKPVFVDIDPDTLNLNSDKLEEAITPRTTAIMPVHCYGHPCNSEKIQKIAEGHNLKVIYDAAHAFAVRDKDGTVLRHGDLSILSFHATKVFNTFEGGAIVCPDAKTKLRIDQIKNFGIASDGIVVDQGINGKMSEFNSALGLLQLDYIDGVIARRKLIDQAYRKGLQSVMGIRCLQHTGGTTANYSYFPILIEPDYPVCRNDLIGKLKDQGIEPRRYFFPLISNFPIYRDFPSANPDNLPVATTVAAQVLCLPIYPDLNMSAVELAIQIIGKQ